MSSYPYEPIFTSLLDVDLYKFRMGQLALLKHPDAEVTFGFHCRTKGAKLAQYVSIDELRWQIAHVRTLRATSDEVAYLKSLGYFGKEYLQFFGCLTLPHVRVRYATDDDGFIIETKGYWPEVMPWETIILGIVNELYFRGRKAEMARQRGTSVLEFEGSIDAGTAVRLREKIEYLLGHRSIRLSEFGTRRRESRKRQALVVAALAASELARNGQLLGTSNVFLARLHGLTPIGTMAHELFMVEAALAGDDDAALLASQGEVLDAWREIADSMPATARNDKSLTDTFGTPSFFRGLRPEQMRVWKGFRGDSGSPIVWTDTAVESISGHGIDPMTKTATYADGIEIPTRTDTRTNLVEIDEYARGKIVPDYGPGTNFTNDLAFVGLKPISIVMKAIAVNGRPTVKLSDNPAKATGPAAEVARYKRVFRYEERPRIECKS